CSFATGPFPTPNLRPNPTKTIPIVRFTWLELCSFRLIRSKGCYHRVAFTGVVQHKDSVARSSGSHSNHNMAVAGFQAIAPVSNTHAGRLTQEGREYVARSGIQTC